jgi:undecaprenyl-diphosphatase
MSIIESVLLGILQGLTEFLPVSSSGQLVLAEHFFDLQLDEGLMKSFDVFLHAGTLLALFILFWRDIWKMLVFLYKAALKKELKEEDKYSGTLLALLVVATIPAVVFALLFEDLIEGARMPLIVAFLLGFTATIFLLAERFPKGKSKTIVDIKVALMMGFFQILGVFPGISRSGMTISGGLFQGVSREVAARFSFMMAMPIILGASILSAIRIIQDGMGDLSIGLIVSGFMASFVVSFIVAKFLLAMFKKISLSFFSIFLFIESALLIYFS